MIPVFKAEEEILPLKDILQKANAKTTDAKKYAELNILLKECKASHKGKTKVVF